MSIFNELLPKINEISNTFTKNFNDDLKGIFECFDKFEEEYQNGRGRSREKTQKDKNPMTTLQSIHEDEDESTKISDSDKTDRRSSNKSAEVTRSSTESTGDKTHRASKKRSKHEVDGLLSPDQDKRQKRNASVKAQSIISKQKQIIKVLEESTINLVTPKKPVNVNLTQKLRREDTTDKSRSHRRKDDDKENAEPIIQIKQEKISLPPEPMDTESLPIAALVKQEPTDEIAMPPPAMPVPKPRKGLAKEKAVEESGEEETGKRRTTRTRKQTDTMPAPPVPLSRSTRASSRTARQLEAEEAPPTETRPKRTRAKKKISESTSTDTEKEATQPPQENGIASPAEKPRPKRTRRGQKAAEKEQPKPEEPKPETQPEIISPKEERISQPTETSPILPQKPKEMKSQIPTKKGKKKAPSSEDMEDGPVKAPDVVLDETRVIPKMDATVVLSEMDKTVVLPNGVYNHAPVTPKNMRNMNETVVLETCNRDTMVLDKPQNVIMDATVVIDKDPKVSDDNSILTDDNSDVNEIDTPPRQEIPKVQPTSAVKEKVQQFEELASRVTRTKTRAMAKKEEPTETQTPPDKISKPILSAETLTKMNSMIFNGKPPQISSSATKPRGNMVTSTKCLIPASTSKLSAISKARAEAEEHSKREKEDARKKKEAMLEAKRELQKRKREEKMAAAAAAREAAEKERKLAMEAAARDKMEKQAHADLGKQERLKEAERKRQELARKVAETEERRRAEEMARQQRLADEQKRADAIRRKQIEEQEAMKKEAAIMAKEIEKRQKEYIEKQKKRLESDKMHTPLKNAGTPSKYASTVEPVYMADGFQFLNSDEDEEPVERPAPMWSTSRARKQQLFVQCQMRQWHVDRLFSVRVHSPDLREIFPGIERSRLKRTSSAVWRTPPSRLPALTE